MRQTSIVTLFIFALTVPTFLFAADNLAILEQVVSANKKTQPDLQNYLVTVETSRIEEMMTSMTTGISADVKPPPPPIITKVWQRNGEDIVYAKQTEQHPYVEKMVNLLSTNLAVELNEMLLPEAQTEQRQKLAKTANVKASEVALADHLIHRLEITFNQPANLNEAFYTRGMRLPQKQIKKLAFDVDTKTNTVNELNILTDKGLQLTVEIRYLEVVGGYIPERFQVTSPDGTIEDIFEATFTKVETFFLPTSMLRTIRRPNLQETLEVFFKNYRINQPIPEDIQTRLKAQ